MSTALIALLVVALFPFGATYGWHAVTLKVVASMAIFLLVCIAGRRYELRKVKSTVVARNSYHAVPDRQARVLQNVAGRIQPLDAFQAMVFALSIVQPSELRQRIDETYISDQRTLRQSVTIDFRVPSELREKREEDLRKKHRGLDEDQPPDPWIFVPFTLARKGVYLDNFKVCNGDGQALSVLSYRESLLLSASALRVLIHQALNIDNADQALPEDVAEAERLALSAIIERNNPDVEKAEGGIKSVTAEEARIALWKMQNIADASSRNLLVLLVEKLASNYPLVASMPLSADGRAIIRYEQTIIPKLDLVPEKVTSRLGARAAELKRWLKGALRVLLGSRPASLTVSLDNAHTCQSFHVRVQSPEGLYLARQELRRAKDDEGYLERRQYNAPTPPHYRFRRRLGQSYAHFYGRFFPSPKNSESTPTLEFQFYETPPGSAFRAAVAAGTCFLLVWVVGLAISIKGDPHTDAPAFLLVFPGVAASWLGFDAAPRGLFESTLVSRVSLFTTTVLSMASSGLYMINVSGVRMPMHPSFWNFGFLGVTRLPWITLVAMALINAAWVSYKWVIQAAAFKYLAGREQ
ncbi:hypothetical protein [Streptomyces guryensis]|uniref:Uncharacterized protein n=1 Tax=Streptomyces guryensis TaxID=2886947 RepID=A0A9Q3Z6C0_9ACTN|nr:hypothetical protein [Streptomyces guryensis]MCD9876761.1 hypothetical protein [Streptomyces guryensis]